MSIAVAEFSKALEQFPSDMRVDIVTHGGVIDVTGAELVEMAIRSHNFNALPGVGMATGANRLLLLLPETMT